ERRTHYAGRSTGQWRLAVGDPRTATARWNLERSGALEGNSRASRDERPGPEIVNGQREEARSASDLLGSRLSSPDFSRRPPHRRFNLLPAAEARPCETYREY